MDIDKKITLTLSKENIEEIVRDYCTKKGFSVNNVNINVKKSVRCEGHGMSERDIETIYLENVTVNCVG